MLSKTRSVNKQGTITTQAGDAVAMLSSYVEESNANMSVNILDKKLLVENKEMVAEDVKQFIGEFLNEAGGSEA